MVQQEITRFETPLVYLALIPWWNVYIVDSLIRIDTMIDRIWSLLRSDLCSEWMPDDVHFISVSSVKTREDRRLNHHAALFPFGMFIAFLSTISISFDNDRMIVFVLSLSWSMYKRFPNPINNRFLLTRNLIKDNQFDVQDKGCRRRMTNFFVSHFITPHQRM